MKVLKELNTADMEIYEHAVKVMVQQKDLLSAVLQPLHCNGKLATAAEALQMGVGYQPDADMKALTKAYPAGLDRRFRDHTQCVQTVRQSTGMLLSSEVALR